MPLIVLVCFSPPYLHAAGKSNTNPTQLQSIIIYISSNGDLKKLRQYPIEIVRVRQDLSTSSEVNSLNTSQIVEAVASQGVIYKLEKLGFDIRNVTSTPPDIKM